MGFPIRAAGLAVLLTTLAGVKEAPVSDYDLWRARRLAREYEVWHWGGKDAARAAARLAELLELFEGKPVKLVDVRAGLPRAPKRGACPVVVGLAEGEVWKDLTREVKSLEGKWKAWAAEQAAFTGVSFFAERAGAPILGVVAVNEAALVASMADASLPGASAPVPDMPWLNSLDESRFVEWSTALPPRADYSLGFVEYCVSPRDTTFEDVKELHARVELALKRFEEAVGPLPKGPGKLQVVLYGTLKDKRVNGGTTSLTTVRHVRGSIEAVEGYGVHAFDPADVVRLVQHRAFGLSPSLALEDGLPSWCARPGELDMARALASSNLSGSVEDLTTPKRRGRRSPLVLTALDRALAGAALAAGPAGPWLRREAPPPAASLLVNGFSELDKPSTAPSPRKVRPDWLDAPWCGFELRTSAGMHWTDSGLGPSLERARSAGATHVVVTTTRYPGSRQASFVKGGGPADGEVAHVASVARSHGLKVLLRTNIGGIRRGGWVGDPFKLKSSEWDSYFDDLGEVWAHDGILARQYCDGWILGAGFRGTAARAETVKHWREWIGRLRRLDAGPLGYAASWQPVPLWVEGAAGSGAQPEFERVGFWDTLDIFGVDASAPVGEGEGGVSRGVLPDLLKSAEKAAAAAKRPLVLFGLGYPATSRGYESPWRRNGEPALAPQAAAFQAALDAVKSHGGVRAVVVSSWPAGAGVNTLGSDWYSPVGRPAEATVRELFEAVLAR